MYAQAGEPVAFFVGKNGSSDGIDAFVTSVLNAGFGSGGEAAEIEVLQRIFQVCSAGLGSSHMGGPVECDMIDPADIYAHCDVNLEL